MAMNEQKEAFARAKVSGLTNKAAAIAAGYSEKTASAAGSRLAKDEDVLEAIASFHKQQAASCKKPQRKPSQKKSVDVAHAENIEVLGGVAGLDQIAESAQNRAIIRGTTVELDGVIYNQADPRDQLLLCQLGVITLTRNQIDAAKTLLPFFHAKMGDVGKKDVERQNAHSAASGKFSAMAAPKKGMLS